MRCRVALPVVVAVAAVGAAVAACPAEVPVAAESEGESSDDDALVALVASPESLDLVVGDHAELTISGRQGDGDIVDVSNRLQLSSSDTAVVTVDDTGSVTARAPGEARITAVVGALTVEVPVRVTRPSPPTRLVYADIVVAAGAPVDVVPDTDARGATFSMTPALPPGLTFNVVSGAITGRVDAVFGPLTFAVTATNAAGAVTGTLVLEVFCDPAAAVPPREVDLPDADFIDENGDGIDGLACGPVFVRDGGDDAADGTIERPVRSIGRALELARGTPGRDVYIAGGHYPGPIALVPDVSLHGGFLKEGFVRTGEETVIAGGNPVVVAADLGEDSSVTLSFLTLEGDDAVVAGGDALAMLLRDAGAVTLSDSVVIAGAGRDGADGVDGRDGADGDAGGVGDDGCASGLACGSCDAPLPGQGAVRPIVDVLGDGGDGGAPGFAAADGENGDPGGGGAAGGLRGFGGTFTGTLRDGDPGRPGDDGQPGGDGDGGAADTDGSDGGDGRDGEGGGGGGGGAGGDYLLCDEYGGAGGGGGSAGSGGTGGAGGQAGGSSVAVHAIGATTLRIERTVLLSGSGGRGGDGGRGGEGGVGGSGGAGGRGRESTDEHRAGHGGRGGDGGDGGRGGHGGGGGGGSSIAVLLEGARLELVEADVLSGRPGAGGAGPGRPGSAGQAAATVNR